MAHYYEECYFSLELFNRKMRDFLYNSKRKPASSAPGRQSATNDAPKAPPLPVPAPGGPIPGPAKEKKEAANDVAARLCRVLQWSIMNSDDFLRRVSLNFGFRREQHQTMDAVQAILDDLHDNVEAGDLAEAQKNLELLRTA